MANKELPATTGGARWIAIAGNRAGDKDGSTYGRIEIIERALRRK
jgi:hypothetical protein